MSTDLITRFYTSFQQRDAAGMLACYHPDVTFSDPAFVNLNSAEVRAMWQMLVERGKDLQLTFSDVQSDGQTGSAHWEPIYTFSTTGRRVHNIIDAKFRFRDGKIIEHRDHFSLWRWSSQALGTSGKLLGWTPFMQNKIRQQSRQILAKYMGK